MVCKIVQTYLFYDYGLLQGDLKQFLLATSPITPPNGTVDSKKDATTKPPPLNVPQILALAHQIGRGMDAIYKARIIHK